MPPNASSTPSTPSGVTFPDGPFTVATAVPIAVLTMWALRSTCANATAASACMPGNTCWYTDIVNAGFECPSRSHTTFTDTPACNSSVAWVWRRSCKVISGTAILATTRSKVWLNTSGWIHVVSGLENTNASSPIGPPASSSRALRHWRRTSTVSSSMSIVRRPDPVFTSEMCIS